jgi:hypothetical protein
VGDQPVIFNNDTQLQEVAELVSRHIFLLEDVHLSLVLKH